MKEFRPILRRHRITEQQWRVLRALNSVTSSEVTALAASTCLLGPSLSRILPQLERRRLIRRTANVDDLRRATISITASGTALIEQVTPQSVAAYARITQRFGAKHLKTLEAMLHDLEAALNGEAE